MNQNKQEIYNRIVEFLKSKGATKVAVFGSYVRNEETPESDIDVMVDFKRPIDLFDIIGIEQDLSDSLGLKVDLLTEGDISPYIISEVKNNMKVLYQ
jgi:predicted nucleotidyltransferase